VRIPAIPDHEMLCVIGRGAYGEIWMARSLTGALRAVKVVHRSTFESERAFNREFAGMSSFEPISRAHDGFVDILHVGRNDAAGFFYYVMELADDRVSGANIDVTRYAPKTLRSDHGEALPVSECLRLGLLLADALSALHREGLAHRDIKPSNIIFVNGAPKLADIGLVATSGQRSFVGTEGYVPPEGPGTAQADLYSLGKVLYEIAMGKDRLDFPEIGTNLEARADKEQLLQFNEVLLKACAHKPTQRYSSADELRQDLERIESGKPAKRFRAGRISIALGSAAVLSAVVAFAIHYAASQKKVAPVPGPATATITTEPTGAMVIVGDRMEKSPATFRGIEAGKHPLRIMLPEFDPVETEISVDASQTVNFPPFKLQRSKGSLQLTSLPAGAEFELQRNHESTQRGTMPMLVRDLPTGTYEIVAKRPDWELHDRVEVKCGEVAIRNFEFANGSVKIISAPTGAMVTQANKELGTTPLLLDEVKPGEVNYELRMSGFKSATVHGMVKPKEQAFLAARLEKRLSPERGRIWQNSLGMRFLPVDAWHMSAWETRVRDWAAFCAATRRPFERPDFVQTDADPVVKVNWRDATDFCQWLTEKERRENFLDETQVYRLPTDQEWSIAAGLPNETGATPEERDGRIRGEFPWGNQWPPPAGAGNYADQAARHRPGAIIENYADGFAATAPAGTFKPNTLGIYDLGGNVWEWCSDLYKAGSRWGVLRGGSWANSNRGELLTSYRNVVDRNERDVIYGFRCVLVSEAEQ
jgi:hypothetical protein